VSPTDGSALPTLDWTNPANVTNYAALGGPTLGQPAPSAQAPNPNVVIEYLGETAVPGDDQSAPSPTYRITVQATAADGTPSTMLQSIYH